MKSGKIRVTLSCFIFACLIIVFSRVGFVRAASLADSPEQIETEEAKDQAFANKSVLFISSYSESFASTPNQITGIKSVLEPEHIKLEIEYMDTKRYSDQENINSFHDRIAYKIEHTTAYDAIIVADDAALQFALDYQEELFKGLPIVFLGINDKERALFADQNQYMAGSIEEASYIENIKLGYHFNPEAKEVIAIVDGTLTGQGDKKQFESTAKEFPALTFRVIQSSDYTFPELAKELDAIGSDSIVLFMNANQDSQETHLDLDEQFAFVKEHCNVPVFRPSVGGVGNGMLGGKMIDYEEMGRIAAHKVLNVFLGNPIDQMELVEETPYYYYFDYELIKQFDIDEKLIPEGAVFVNRAINPFDKYRKYFVIAGIILIFLLFVSVILIIDNIKRRKIQKELKESNEKLVSTYDELSATYEELEASQEELTTQCEVVEEHAKQVNLLYQKYDIAIQGTNSAVWELDLATQMVEVSKNFGEIVNKKIQKNENMYHMLELIILEEYREKVIFEIQKYIAGELDEINIQVPTNDEEEKRKWILIRGKGIGNNKDQMQSISGIFLDITTMRKQEEYINFFANHDYLTGLPNRMYFREMLAQELELSRSGAVFLLDLDDFKSINDTLGHLSGDELLRQIAVRLNAVSDEHFYPARIGGDEFLVLITDCKQEEEIEAYAKRVKDVFTKPFVLGDYEKYISISMGITCFPKDSTDIDQLVMNADTAMYKVKNNGKQNVIYYQEEMKKEMKTKLEIDSILREAIANDGFYLCYQPQVDAVTGYISGWEALLRLKDSKLGPAIFIPVAEETGHIVAIGRWIVREAVSQIAKWRDQGLQEKVVAINYSSRQLRDSGFISYLKSTLKEFGVNPEFIEIEITEGILLENNDQTMQFLNDLKKAGIRIALDDFGTGYSSLNYLTYIPVDKIKLDKSINDRFLDLENTDVMDSLILLAHSLNLKITAEGIEDMEKFEKLKNGGCDYIQGYLFSKPLLVKDTKEVYNQDMMQNILERGN